MLKQNVATLNPNQTTTVVLLHMGQKNQMTANRMQTMKANNPMNQQPTMMMYGGKKSKKK